MTLANLPKNKLNSFGTKEINILNCPEWKSEISFLRWEYQLGSLKEKRSSTAQNAETQKLHQRRPPYDKAQNWQVPKSRNLWSRIKCTNFLSGTLYSHSTGEHTNHKLMSQLEREFCPLFWSVWGAFQYVTALGVAYSQSRKAQPLNLEFKFFLFLGFCCNFLVNFPDFFKKNPSWKIQNSPTVLSTGYPAEPSVWAHFSTIYSLQHRSHVL